MTAADEFWRLFPKEIHNWRYSWKFDAISSINKIFISDLVFTWFSFSGGVVTLMILIDSPEGVWELHLVIITSEL